MSINFVIEKNRGDLACVELLGSDNHFYIYDSGALAPTSLKLPNMIYIKSYASTAGLSLIDFLLSDYRPGIYTHTVFASCDALGSAPNLRELVPVVSDWRSVQCLSIYDSSQANIPPDLLVKNQKSEWLNGVIPVRSQVFSLFDLTSIDHMDARYINAGMDYCNVHSLPYGSPIVSDFLKRCGFDDLAESSGSYSLGRRSHGLVVGINDDLLEHTVSRNRDSFTKMRSLLIEHPDVSSFLFKSVFMHLFGQNFVGIAV